MNHSRFKTDNKNRRSKNNPLTSCRFFIFLIILSLCLTWGLTFTSSNIHAAGDASYEDDAPLAVVLLADTSTSMLESDPDMLRYTALRSFIDLLGANDYLSLITFDTGAEKIWPLTKLGSANARQKQKNQLDTALVAGGDSDYLAAFRLAREELDKRPAGTRPLVVIVTDGEPSPDWQDYENPVIMRAYMDELKDETKTFADLSYPLYSVGFSVDVNREVLDDMAMMTKGQVVLLDSPLRLELGLYHLIREVKNRTLILEENHTLTANQMQHSVPLSVDEHTSQIKLFLAHPGMKGKKIDIKPPSGANQARQSYINEHQDYSLIVIEPTSTTAAQGLWTVNIEGIGALGVYADKDLHTKPTILSPLTNTQQASNEAIAVQVEILNDSGLSIAEADGYSVSATLLHPDGFTSTPVELSFDENLFVGEIPVLTELGDYKIDVSLELDGQLISNSTSNFRIKNLPQIQIDFYTGTEPHRFGKEQLVTAQIRSNDILLKPGNTLDVSRFELQLIPEDGSAGELLSASFSNDGTNGDAKAADEHWTGVLHYAATGNYKAVVYLEGRFSDIDFSSSRELGQVVIATPGSIQITADNATWFTGQENVLQVNVSNQSPFRQKINFALLDENYNLVNPEHILAPEESKTLALKVSQVSDAEADLAALDLTVTVEDQDVLLEQETLHVEIELLNKRSWIVANVLSGFTPYLPILILLIALFMLFILGGLAGYYIRILPNTLLSGVLEISWQDRNKQTAPAVIHKGKQPREKEQSSRASNPEYWFQLNRLKKAQAKVVLGEEQKDADLSIPESRYKITIHFEQVSLPVKNRISSGWAAVFGKQGDHSDLIVRAEAPGFLQFGERILSNKVIHSGEAWQVGDLRLVYINKKDEKDSGKNILDGKI